MEIGPRIKNLRNSHGINLKALAEKTGLTTSFLSQLERNLTSPSINSLEKIAHALSAKVSGFFSDGKEELIYGFKY